jgi:eukaryotic-like serine/threonine-protein kinase
LPPSRFAVSPDGQYLCFVAGRVDKANTTLWLRSLDRESARELPGTEGAASPFWSPDSRFIAFFAGGKLKKLDIAGGPPVPLTDAETGGTAGTWSKDDIIVFPRLRRGLYRIDAGGGPVTAVTSLDVAAGDDRHWWPYFLPDGRHFLYEAVGSPSSINDPRAVYVGSLDPAQKPRLLLNGGSNAKFVRDYVLFMRESTLMAQRFDTHKLEITGEPLAIAENVDIGGSTGQSGAFSVSSAGVLVYETARDVSAKSFQLAWFDRSGNRLPALTKPATYGANIELSPDATRAVVNVLTTDRAGTDFWILDLVRRNSWPFARSGVVQAGAAWSHDGSRIAFNGPPSTRDLYVKSSDGTGSEEVILSDAANKVPLSWSYDGQFLLYATLQIGNGDLWVLPLSGDRKPIRYMQTLFNENGARFSPDGRWVAFGSNLSGRPAIYVAPFPETGKREVVSTGDTGAVRVGARWRRDGQELFYISSDRQMMAADIDGSGPDIKIGSTKPLFRIPGSGPIAYDVDQDGQRFLVDFADQR